MKIEKMNRQTIRDRQTRKKTKDTKPTQTKQKSLDKPLQTIRNRTKCTTNDTKQESNKHKRYEMTTNDILGNNKRYKNVQTIRNFGICQQTKYVDK